MREVRLFPIFAREQHLPAGSDKRFESVGESTERIELSGQSGEFRSELRNQRLLEHDGDLRYGRKGVQLGTLDLPKQNLLHASGVAGAGRRHRELVSDSGIHGSGLSERRLQLCEWAAEYRVHTLQYHRNVPVVPRPDESSDHPWHRASGFPYGPIESGNGLLKESFQRRSLRLNEIRRLAGCCTRTPVCKKVHP